MIKCGITGARGVLGKKIRKNLPYKFYIFNKDITNKKEVKKWIDKNEFDIFIHLAAKVPVKTVNKNYKKAYKVNVDGTLNLINSLNKKKNKPKWLFYASTSHVYKINYKPIKITEKGIIKPQNKYGKTKLIAEKILINKSNIKYCIGRIFSFTDNMQKPPYVIPSITKKIKFSKKAITLHNLNHYRDFLNIKDITSAIDILRKNEAMGIYNIGTGYQFNLRTIAELIAKKFKKKINFSTSKKSTFLISNSNKLLKLNWKPRKYNMNLKYFY
jgi:nucleoside-diphosphate-sugar epimerase